MNELFFMGRENEKITKEMRKGRREMFGERTVISQGGKMEGIIGSWVFSLVCKWQADASRAEENGGLISICSQVTDNTRTMG